MDVYKATAELLPELTELADRWEQQRCLGEDLADRLREAGLLRLQVPARYGGLGVSLPETLGIIEDLATADASVAWSVGQVALSHLIICCADPDTASAVYRDGPDVYAAGAVAPKGRATWTPDGWKLSGRWPFVTGCQNASWLYLNCLMVKDRSVQAGDDGTPLTRVMLIPAAQADIVDTWDSLGLRGTGSHDVSVSGAVCPDDRTVAMTPAAADSFAQSSLIIAAVATGTARAALDDLVALASGGKRPALSAGRLAAQQTFQDRLGEAHTTLRAAKALLREASGPVVSRPQTRAAAARVTSLAVDVVDTAYQLAGGTAVYRGSPLQRRMRDAHTITQHFAVGRASYTTVGALLAGEPVPSNQT